MKHYIAFLCLCTLHWITPTSGRANVNFLDLDLNEVRSLAGEKGKLYFAFFTANWCAPCHWMEQRTFTDRRLAVYVAQHYLPVKIDIDERESRIHQERFQVTLLPSILIFNAQGQLLAKVETALSAEDLLEILEEHNLPQNRIGSTPDNARNPSILDSPKPYIKLYRPPLPSEQRSDDPPPPTELPPPVVTTPAQAPSPAKRPAYSDSPPVRPNTRETFAPRSKNNFSIQMATYDSYEQAIRQVAQLESGFKDPIRLLGGTDDSGKQVFRIFIGIFPDRKQAENFLYYLRRKNMSGVIKEMNTEK